MFTRPALTLSQSRSGHGAAIYDLAVTVDGFYSAAADGYLVYWHREDVDLGRVVANVDGGKFLCLTTIPDGLAAGTLDGGVHWLYPEASERNRHIAHHGGRGTFCVIRVGQEVFSGGADGRLTRWSVPEARSLETLPVSTNSLRRIVHDPVYDRLAVGASDGSIYLLDRATFALLDRALAHAPSVFALDFSADGEYLFSGGRDAHLARWHVLTGRLHREQRVPAHLMTVNALALSPDGQFLATASRDKTIKLWRPDDLKLLKVVEGIRDRGHLNSVNTLAWLNDKTLVTAGDDRRVLEWEVVNY